MAAHESISGACVPPSDWSAWRCRLNILLFQIRTPAGRACNLLIMLLIVGSVLISMLGTVRGLDALWLQRIRALEIGVSWLFVCEYLLRLYAAERPRDYALGFYGIVDLLTVLPLLLTGDPGLAIRLLRVLRLIKLVRYMKALRLFFASMRDTMEVIAAVLAGISVSAILAGNLVYALEPGTFSDAFAGAWWSIVTMTTVGYGDIVPQTVACKVIAVLLMVFGIAMFAMVTGVVSVKVARTLINSAHCGACGRQISSVYRFCPHCGAHQQATEEAPAVGHDEKQTGRRFSAG